MKKWRNVNRSRARFEYRSAAIDIKPLLQKMELFLYLISDCEIGEVGELLSIFSFFKNNNFCEINNNVKTLQRLWKQRDISYIYFFSGLPIIIFIKLPWNSR